MTAAARYRTRQRTLEAVQFDGTNLAEITALLEGSGVLAFIDREDGRLVLRKAEREDRKLLPLWWVSKCDGKVTSHSTQAFSLWFESATP